MFSSASLLQSRILLFKSVINFAYTGVTVNQIKMIYRIKQEVSSQIWIFNTCNLTEHLYTMFIPVKHDTLATLSGCELSFQPTLAADGCFRLELLTLLPLPDES